jgi:heat shock protein 5
MSSDPRALQRLRQEVERAKRRLSTEAEVRLEVDSLFDGVDFSEQLTRAKFEGLNADLFRRLVGPIKKVCVRVSSPTPSACLLCVSACVCL